MTSSKEPKTVAIILIGNELLSGKIADLNGHYAMRRLRALGAAVTRLAIIPDERREIVEELQRCVAQNDVVITSGGVGPTHDDITLECIAEAFGVECELHPRLGALITRYFDDRATEAHFRMARIPSGSELIDAGPETWPIVKTESVYVLPGVPEIFKAKFESLADVFRQGQWFLRSLYLNVDEGTVAPLLDRLEREFGVSIGSYPKWRGADYRVRVTVEARTGEAVDAAVEAALAALEQAQVVRVDPGLDTTD